MESAQSLASFFQGWDFVSRAGSNFTLLAFLFLRIHISPSSAESPQGAETEPLASS